MKNKNKGLTFILSFLPGLGHLYLGLKNQGLELMGTFLLCIYLIDSLRVGILMIALPLIWFYSFFDAMEKLNSEEPLIDEDISIIKWFKHGDMKFKGKNKIVGIGLILVGCALIFNKVLMPVVERIIGYGYISYIETSVVAIIFIIGGIYLMMGRKVKLGEQNEKI
ncbi:MAG: hypothetical protein ACERKV_09370 [Clostridiaceae bacterium]